ncbi:MAG: alpha/beta hydrolase domain-containing protein [Bryobacteraceae bacterium]
MLLRCAAFALAATCLASAAVTRIEVVDRSDIPAYNYERIAAKAYFTLDPQNPSNRIIRDIDYAPKNASGQVEFSADLFVLKPRNPVEGNGTILFEVSNRGRKGLINMFNLGASTYDPKAPGDFGDGFLMRRGFTLVWLGWQADVAQEAGLMRMFAPSALRPGNPITGTVRSQWIPETKETEHNLGDRAHIPYPVRPGTDDALKLTVRDSYEAAPRRIPRDQWKLARTVSGELVPDRGIVHYPAGFVPGKIYELVYESQDPTIVGLGPAGIRDIISFLKYENAGTTLLGDQSRFLKRAIGVGTSQSGRFLRTFLYFGFNKDEKNRKVFDGVWAHVAGGGRGSFNHRFAQPSRDGHPYMNILYPTDIFPFSDQPQTDPDTGLTDSILARAEQDNVAPKIFYTNSSYEYWGRSASLIHTSIDGKTDGGTSANTRAYLFSGTQHGPGAFPPSKSVTANLANANDYRYLMRALLVSMHDWLKDGAEPPASQIPKVANGTLVAHTALAFPKLQAVTLPKRIQQAWRADFGPEFRSHGIITNDPPKLGRPFVTLVPQVDADGNELAGIRLPEIQVPLASYTGWNMRAPHIGAPQEMYSMVGSFFPFASAKAARAAAGDPRPSIAERYPNKQAYLEKIATAARQLVKDRYVLAEDLFALEQRASKQWDALAGK